MTGFRTTTHFFRSIRNLPNGLRLRKNHPELAEQRLKEVVIMGGVNLKDGEYVFTNGLLTPDTAFNNICDNEAAEGVMEWFLNTLRDFYILRAKLSVLHPIL